jgi:hypothetical protein
VRWNVANTSKPHRLSVRFLGSAVRADRADRDQEPREGAPRRRWVCRNCGRPHNALVYSDRHCGYCGRHEMGRHILSLGDASKAQAQAPHHPYPA